MARELFDVLRFPYPSGDESPAQDVDGVGERWQALRDRLLAEGDLAEGDLPAAEAPRVPGRRRATWMPLAAMFVLGVAVTWITDRWRQADVTVDPRINLAIVELLPVDDGTGSLRGAEVVTMDAGTGGLVLTLAVPGRGPTPEQGPYTLELTRGDGTTRTLDGLAPGVGGVFVLDLPREEWAAGVHELRLKDRDGQSVARFQLEVVLRR